MAERATPFLGPRASMLLGMLHQPMTVAELLHLARTVRDCDDVEEIAVSLREAFGFVGGDVSLTLQQIGDGGEQEVRRLLTRLEAVGLVRRAVYVTNEAHLWWRI